MALLATVAACLHARIWSFTCDDAYISLRYARHLAEAGQLAFNLAPFEKVEGYTNFLWVVVLAAAHAVGFDLAASAQLLGIAALAGLVVAATGLTVTIAAPRGPAGWAGPLAVPLALALLPEVVVWGTSGLETSFGAAWVFAALLAWARDRPRTAAICAALAGLTRLDSLVPLAAFGLTWVAVHGRARGLTLGLRPRVLLQALGLFAAPLLLHLLWRHAYYGAWLPNTWAVKLHGARLRDTWGVAYLQAWTAALHLPYLAPLLWFVRPRHLPALAAAIATVFYAWSVGGDFMAYSRLLLVATVATVIVAACAVTTAADRLAGRPRPWHLPAWAPAVLLVPVLAGLGIATVTRYEQDRRKPEGWLDGKWEGVTAMERFALVGTAAGAWLARHVPADTVITVGAAGAVPYASDLPTIDAFGLVDPVLARLPEPPLRARGARPGHQLFAPVSYIRQRDPDLLCHVGFRGAAVPRESQAMAPFRRGYRWACIHLGELDDGHGGSFDAGVYCCRRPEGRTVGPFAD